MENSEQFDLEFDKLMEAAAAPEAENTSAEPVLEATEENGSVNNLKTENTDPKPATKAAQDWQKSILLYLHDLIYILAALLVVSLLLIRVVVVSGTSMYDTLLDGDYLFVLSNSVYREPKAGDIVVISKESFDNGSPIVKRVIATEGQVVDIDFNLGIVYVDGEALSEPYVHTATTMKEGVTFPLTVEEGCIFVLGDNRGVSKDSRSPEIGQIDEHEVLGKVVFLFLPGTNGKDVNGRPREPRDWTRIGVVE